MARGSRDRDVPHIVTTDKIGREHRERARQKSDALLRQIQEGKFATFEDYEPVLGGLREIEVWSQLPQSYLDASYLFIERVLPLLTTTKQAQDVAIWIQRASFTLRDYEKLGKLNTRAIELAQQEVAKATS